MKGMFKVIELDGYDVLIQKHWSQTKEDLDKNGFFQIKLSFWKDLRLNVLTINYLRQSSVNEDFDNINKDKVQTLINDILNYE